MDNPLVSVIIAVKNGERFLVQAINSVLEQDYRPFEVIVVDGQSTDKTAMLAKSYAECRYIYQTGQGIADAYNVGVEAARGKFVSFLSHDDLWTPDKLTCQVRYLLEHESIQYTVAKVRYFLEEGQSIPRGFRKELLDGEHVAYCMETLVTRQSLFDVVGKFDTEYVVAEDVDWFARTIDCQIPMAVIPKVLLYKRVHDQSTSIINLDTQSELFLKILRRSIQRKRNMGNKGGE